MPCSVPQDVYSAVAQQVRRGGDTGGVLGLLRPSLHGVAAAAAERMGWDQRVEGWGSGGWAEAGSPQPGSLQHLQRERAGDLSLPT